MTQASPGVAISYLIPYGSRAVDLGGGWAVLVVWIEKISFTHVIRTVF